MVKYGPLNKCDPFFTCSGDLKSSVIKKYISISIGWYVPFGCLKYGTNIEDTYSLYCQEFDGKRLDWNQFLPGKLMCSFKKTGKKK